MSWENQIHPLFTAQGGDDNDGESDGFVKHTSRKMARREVPRQSKRFNKIAARKEQIARGKKKLKPSAVTATKYDGDIKVRNLGFVKMTPTLGSQTAENAYLHACVHPVILEKFDFLTTLERAQWVTKEYYELHPLLHAVVLGCEKYFTYTYLEEFLERHSAIEAEQRFFHQDNTRLGQAVKAFCDSLNKSKHERVLPVSCDPAKIASCATIFATCFGTIFRFPLLEGEFMNGMKDVMNLFTAWLKNLDAVIQRHMVEDATWLSMKARIKSQMAATKKWSNVYAEADTQEALIAADQALSAEVEKRALRRLATGLTEGARKRIDKIIERERNYRMNLKAGAEVDLNDIITSEVISKTKAARIAKKFATRVAGAQSNADRIKQFATITVEEYVDAATGGLVDIDEMLAQATGEGLFSWMSEKFSGLKADISDFISSTVNDAMTKFFSGPEASAQLFRMRMTTLVHMFYGIYNEDWFNVAFCAASLVMGADFSRLKQYCTLEYWTRRPNLEEIMDSSHEVRVEGGSYYIEKETYHRAAGDLAAARAGGSEKHFWKLGVITSVRARTYSKRVKEVFSLPDRITMWDPAPLTAFETADNALFIPEAERDAVVHPASEEAVAEGVVADVIFSNMRTLYSFCATLPVIDTILNDGKLEASGKLANSFNSICMLGKNIAEIRSGSSNMLTSFVKTLSEFTLGFNVLNPRGEADAFYAKQIIEILGKDPEIESPEKFLALYQAGIELSVSETLDAGTRASLTAAVRYASGKLDQASKMAKISALRPGTTLAFLIGPPGNGKTTTMQSLSARFLMSHLKIEPTQYTKYIGTTAGESQYDDGFFEQSKVLVYDDALSSTDASINCRHLTQLIALGSGQVTYAVKAAISEKGVALDAELAFLTSNRLQLNPKDQGTSNLDALWRRSAFVAIPLGEQRDNPDYDMFICASPLMSAVALKYTPEEEEPMIECTDERFPFWHAVVPKNAETCLVTRRFLYALIVAHRNQAAATYESQLEDAQRTAKMLGRKKPALRDASSNGYRDRSNTTSARRAIAAMAALATQSTGESAHAAAPRTVVLDDADLFEQPDSDDEDMPDLEDIPTAEGSLSSRPFDPSDYIEKGYLKAFSDPSNYSLVRIFLGIIAAGGAIFGAYKALTSYGPMKSRFIAEDPVSGDISVIRHEDLAAPARALMHGSDLARFRQPPVSQAMVYDKGKSRRKMVHKKAMREVPVAFAQGSNAIPTPVTDLAHRWPKSSAYLKLQYECDDGMIRNSQAFGVWLASSTSRNILMVPNHCVPQNVVAITLFDAFTSSQGVDVLAQTVYRFGDYDLCLLHFGDLLTQHRSSALKTFTEHEVMVKEEAWRFLAHKTHGTNVLDSTQICASPYGHYVDPVHRKKIAQKGQLYATIGGSEAGNCGSIIVHSVQGAAKICGIHVAGDGTNGMFVYLNQNTVKSMLAIIDSDSIPATPLDVEDSDIVPVGENGGGDIAYGSFPQGTEFVEEVFCELPVKAKLPKNWRHNPFGTNRIKKTPISEQALQILHEEGLHPTGARLTMPIRTFASRDFPVDPVPVAFKGCNPRAPAYAGPFDDDFFEEFCRHYPRIYDMPLWPIEDACVLANDKASAGLFWKVHGCGKKQDLWDDEGTPIPIFDAAVSKILEKAYRGEVLDFCPCALSIKQETRPVEKVKAGKVRLFASVDAAFAIAFSMMFGAADKYIKSRSGFAPVRVGINVHGGDWKMLSEKYRVGRFTAYDAAGFDKNLPRIGLSMALRCFNYLYSLSSTREEDLARQTLFAYIFSPDFVFEDRVIKMPGWLPSGIPLTSVIDSIVEWYMLYTASRTAIALENGLVTLPVVPGSTICDPSSEHLFWFDLYGDDNLCGTTIDDFDWNVIPGLANQLLGVTYTAVDKSDNFMATSDYRELEFLKRTFRPDAVGRVQAPLPLDVILEIPFWGETINVPTIQSQLDAMMLELTHHGPEVHRAVERAFSRDPYIRRHSLTILTRDQAERRRYSGDLNW